MRIFKITGAFPAEDIDDAIRLLGEHFTTLAADACAETVLQSPAYIDVRPADSGE